MTGFLREINVTLLISRGYIGLKEMRKFWNILSPSFLIWLMCQLCFSYFVLD